MRISVLPSSAGTRRIILILGGFSALLVGMFAFVEWDLRRLENAVWEKNQFAGLSRQQGWLNHFSGSEVLPKSMRSRSQGLLGDLAFHKGQFEQAMNRYVKSVEWVGTLTGADPATALKLVAGGGSEFHRGYGDYEATAPIPPQPDDKDFALAVAVLDPSENAWDAFLAIAPLDGSEVESVRTLFATATDGTQKIDEISRFCVEKQETIAALKALGPAMTVPASNFLDLARAGDFCRLLFLEALRSAESGQLEKAGDSFDAAYRMIGHLEQNPSLFSMLATLALRSRIAGFLESESGAQLATFFEEKHQLAENAYDRFLRGACRESRQIISEALPGSDSVSARLRVRTLEKNLAFWRAVRADGSVAQTGDSFESRFSAGFFRNRRFIHRPDLASYPDGYRFAGEAENLVAEILFWTARPNLGAIDRSFEELREREARILGRRKSEN